MNASKRLVLQPLDLIARTIDLGDEDGLGVGDLLQDKPRRIYRRRNESANPSAQSKHRRGIATHPMFSPICTHFEAVDPAMPYATAWPAPSIPRRIPVTWTRSCKSCVTAVQN